MELNFAVVGVRCYRGRAVDARSSPAFAVCKLPGVLECKLCQLANRERREIRPKDEIVR